MTTLRLAAILTLSLAMAAPAAAQPCGDLDGDGAVTSSDVQGLKWVVRKLAYPWLSLPSWLDGDGDGAADGCPAPAIVCGAGTKLSDDGSTCELDATSEAVLALLADACEDEEEPPVVEPTAWFSEVRVDHPGLDTEEFIELAAEPDAALDDLTVLVIGDGDSGDGGVIEEVISLDGLAVDDSGYLVLAESAFALGEADVTQDLNLENSDNLTFLLVEGFDGEDGDDLDADDDGDLDVFPWEAEHDRVALIEEDNPPLFTEPHYGPPTAGPDGTLGPGHAYLCDEVWYVGAFDPSDLTAADSPGEANCD